MKVTQQGVEALKRLVDVDRSSMHIRTRSSYDAQHVIVNREDLHELLRMVWSIGGQNIDEDQDQELLSAVPDPTNEWYVAQQQELLTA